MSHARSVVAAVTVLLCRSTVRSLENTADAPLRGVPSENAKLYVPSKDFLCLDGTFSIPYSYVNDDYCDCLDASDEPGTSACPNGTFYCKNTGYLPLVIPSSRVHDGICDCCDGSDEWSNNVRQSSCKDICEELDHAAKIEADRIDNLYDLGFKIREELITKGKFIISKKHKYLLYLLSKKRDAQFIRSNLFNDKEEAEKKEINALKLEKLKQQNEAFKIFNEIDTNKNKKIEVKEVIAYSSFDQDKNGLVSQDEIYYFMEGKTELNIDDFMSVGWNRLNLLIFTRSIDTQHRPIEINSKVEDNNNVNKETGKYDMESGRINEFLYSEKTRNIINEAKQARELFEEANERFEQIQRNIFETQKSMRKNFGPEDEFAALDGLCYELTVREYIYKLCLFENVTQKSIEGGFEVSLGVWNDWTDFINNETKYHTMLYDRGDKCLNRQRLTYVHLSCGLEPKLLSVTEPNVCEYLMQFQLPSVCVKQDTKYSKELNREEL